VTVKADLDNRALSCSVHDLIRDPSQRAIAAGREGLSRLTVGAELHRVVQRERAATDSDYRPEVGIDTTFEIDGWTLRVLGRADGVSRTADGKGLLEEIKTLHFRTELHTIFAEERLERYRWQARIYACCLFPDGDAAARLLLVDLGGEERRTEEVAWSPGEVRAYLRARLYALVAAERERERLLSVLRAAAEDLPFPFAQVRPVQGEAMEAVGEALETGRHLLLSAPTGVGKTAAALYPAVRLALARGRRVAFLTAKTLQQHLAVETLQRMQGGGWHSLRIRAKAKMCANREVICHEEFCLHARDYAAKLVERGVLPALLSFSPHLDPDRIYEIAHAAEVCPFEVSLELLAHVSAVVADYNYVFDPSIALFGSPFEGSLEDTYLIVDEAHNLVDRAREYYSPRLTRRAINDARSLVRGYRQRVCRDLAELLFTLEAVLEETLNRALDGHHGVARAIPDQTALADARLAMDALIAPYFTFKRSVELWLAADPIIDVLLALARVVDLLEDGGSELVPLAERVEEHPGNDALRIFCLDASRFTGAVLSRCAGCVAMSATLEPFEFYRDLLGFDPDRTDTVTLSSPFPRENRLVVAVDEVDTSYRYRARAYGRIAELVGELAPPGRNALVLFPSYAFLNEIAGRLIAPHHRVEVQRGDDSERLRREMLDRLRANREPVLLLAVLGGVFAEGVDYPGEMLSEVIVVSPALPQVGPERELLKRYYQEQYERGFEYAYLVPGMTRVVQAAGRLIRSQEDRGVIVLVCRRFLRQPYSLLLPADWIAEGVLSLRSGDPAEAVRAFFGSPTRPT
jgi:DNA excision repair protein ERCC-2